MRPVLSLSIGFVFLALACQQTPAPAPVVADPESRRSLPAGAVVGRSTPDGAHAWHAIPFAKPPVGALRWRAPEPLPPWQGVRQSLTPPGECVQYPMPFVNEADLDVPVGSEDCLYLSVYAPRAAPDAVPAGRERLPVLFWIHGGANLTGTSATYDWSRYAAKHGVVVVATNYRLGPFGWFRHPALWADGDDAFDRSGNFGTLDLIRGLEWVRDNIGAFGGDPGNVMIFGESAGGNDVIALLLSPPAGGLFHRAISQSGGTWSASVAEAENWTDDPEPGRPFSAREFTARLVMADGLAADRGSAKAYVDGADPVALEAYLRGKSQDEIMAVLVDRSEVNMGSMPLTIRGGTVVAVGEMIDSFRAGNFHRVPTILGTNRDETKLFMMMSPEYTWKLFGLLPRFRDRNVYERDAEHASDAWKADGADQIAAAIESHGAGTVYGYRFDWDEEPSLMGTDMGTLLGAAHGVEIPFVMGAPALGPLMSLLFGSERDLAEDPLSVAMGSYWAEFAKDGAPGRGTSGTLPLWSAWDSSTDDSPRFLIFDSAADGGIRMSSDYRTPKRIAERVFADARYEDDAARCEALVELVEMFPHYTEEDRVALGCAPEESP
jgi:para-nitrobenzyl esterase